MLNMVDFLIGGGVTAAFLIIIINVLLVVCYIKYQVKKIQRKNNLLKVENTNLTTLTIRLNKGKYEDVLVFINPDKLQSLLTRNGVVSKLLNDHLCTCGKCFFQCDGTH